MSTDSATDASTSHRADRRSSSTSARLDGKTDGTVELPGDDLRRAGQRPADPPGRRRPARRGPPGHAQHQDAAARSAAVGASRTARRAPAGPVRARPARRSSPAVASSTARSRADYAQRTPKKMKAAALRGALSDRARNGRIHVVDRPARRRRAVDQDGHRACSPASRERKHVLVVVQRSDELTWKSLRNAAARAPARRRTSSTPTTCSSPTTWSSPAAPSTSSWPAPPRAARPRPAPPRARSATEVSVSIHKDHRDVLLVAGRLGEELRPARREQVHVPGPPGRQQDRRSRSRSRRSSASRSPG